MTSDTLGVDQIRTLFPALDRVHAGHSVAYFDGPGGTQVPQSVADAVRDYLFNHNANTHWAYESSAETDRLLAQARVAFADFLNGRPSEVVFGQNMTTLTYHLSRALGREWGPGDEIVITQLDHMANQSPWRALEAERGLTVRRVPMTRDGELDWDVFEEMVGDRTRLVAVGAASNALGTCIDMQRAIGMARAVGARVFVDAVHSAHHELPDVAALDCDFLACSPYKFYGPHLGVLWVRGEIGEALRPPRVACAGAAMPEKLETGTLNHEGIAGAAAAVDFLADLTPGAGTRRERLLASYRTLHTRGERLLQRLWEGLRVDERATVYGRPPDADRTSTLAFTFRGVPSEAVTRHLSDRWGVFTSHGDFYASGVTEALGLEEEGLVRIGMACYSTEGEVDRLLRGLGALSAE